MAGLAEVLRLGGAAYLRTHDLSTPQARAWRAICACRTPLLGGQQMACAACGHRHWHYHSCRIRGGGPFPQGRHCPQCGARAKEAWLRGRLAEVLQVPYVHLVFTLPHDLNSLYRAAPKWLIETLFACVAATLKDFAANARWMGVEGGQPPCRPRQASGLALRQAQGVHWTPCVRAQPSAWCCTPGARTWVCTCTCTR